MNKSDNLLIFPKAKRPVAAVDSLNVSTIKTLKPTVFTGRNIFFWVLSVIRLPFFLVMYWLRLPILFVCNAISGLGLVAWLFAWYAFPETNMVWGFAYASLAAFVISWVYDFILMAISPQSMITTL